MNYKYYVPKKTDRELTLKKCSKCHEEKPLRYFYYHHTRKIYMSVCRECNDKRVTNYYQTNKDNPHTVFQLRAGHIYRDCRIKKIPYSKKLGVCLEKLWESTNHRCFYTNRIMKLHGYHTDNDAVTVDRIIPKKGYVEGNVVLCCSIANRSKQNLSFDEFIALCRNILDNENNVRIKLTSFQQSSNV